VSVQEAEMTQTSGRTGEEGLSDSPEGIDSKGSTSLDGQGKEEDAGAIFSTRQGVRRISLKGTYTCVRTLAGIAVMTPLRVVGDREYTHIHIHADTCTQAHVRTHNQ